MASLSSNVTHMPLSYHEVTALRLPLVTAAGLQAAGIPLEALGTRDGKIQVFLSFFTLSPFCKGNLATKSGWNSWRIFDSSQPSISRICSQSSDRQPYQAHRLRTTTLSGDFSVGLHLDHTFLPRHALRPSSGNDNVNDVCLRGRFYHRKT